MAFTQVTVSASALPSFWSAGYVTAGAAPRLHVRAA